MAIALTGFGIVGRCVRDREIPTDDNYELERCNREAFEDVRNVGPVCEQCIQADYAELEWASRA